MPNHLKLALAFCLLITACGGSDPLEALVPGERGRVVRIIDGDALVLDTGQSVRLVGLEAPAPARRDRAGQPHADKSSRMLEDMALGRRVRLYYAGLTRDRYDRALAHVLTDDQLGPRLWLNLEMVSRGGARVRTWPDTALAAGVLVEAERDARETGRGLWGHEAYRVRQVREVEETVRGFTIVEGILGEARRETGPDVACRRSLLASEITLTIERPAGEICATATGHRVRVRGWLSDGWLSINHAANVEILPRQSERVAGSGDPS